MKAYLKSYGIYRKGKVAAQFKLQHEIERPGIFLELSDEPRGEGFNWDNKITVKLGMADLGKILDGLETSTEEISLFHDPGAGTEHKGEVSKNIQFKKAAKGSYYLNVSLVESRKVTKKISIALSPAEVRTLMCLIDVAIPKILGWD